MVLTTPGNSGEFVKMVVENMTYLGPKDLTLYFIRETRMKTYKENEIVVEVSLNIF